MQVAQELKSIILSQPQEEFFFSDANETFFMAGRGSGKSYVLGELVREMAYISGSITLLAAPTYDMLRGSTLQQVLNECLYAKYGIEEGVHYVIGKQPPKQWGVKAFSPIRNHNIITWCTGAYTVVDALENFNKHRGAEYDRQLIDEFNNVTPEVRDVLLGCKRGRKMRELGVKSQIYYAMTPPRKLSTAEFMRELMDKLRDKPDIAKFIRGTSHDNAHNLPDDFISSLEASMDDRTLQRELMGELVMDNLGAFAYEFDADHISSEAVYNPEKRLYFFMDFNIDYMACSVWQLGEGWANCIDEFEPSPSVDIDDRCRHIIARYGLQVPYSIFTGDPSGRNRTGLGKGLQYYIKLRDNLQIKDNQIQKRKHAPEHDDSRQDVNSILSRFKIKINPKCKWTIQDLRYCTVDAKGKIDKSDPRRTHYLDALRYGWDYHLVPMLRDRNLMHQLQKGDLVDSF